MMANSSCCNSTNARPIMYTSTTSPSDPESRNSVLPTRGTGISLDNVPALLRYTGGANSLAVSQFVSLARIIHDGAAQGFVA